MLRIHACPVAQLAGLYQHCAMYLSAATDDGCGVTVLEAMRAGARVVASRVGAIPEVAGDIPQYFDPNSGKSLLMAVRRVLDEEPEKRAERTRVGRHRAMDYTWENCALKMLSALRRAGKT